jgi:hypothetical protein
VRYDNTIILALKEPNMNNPQRQLGD